MVEMAQYGPQAVFFDMDGTITSILNLCGLSRSEPS